MKQCWVNLAVTISIYEYNCINKWAKNRPFWAGYGVEGNLYLIKRAKIPKYYNDMKKTRLFPIILVLITLAVNWGCGGGGVTDGNGTSQYLLYGGLVKNLDLGTVVTAVEMQRDDSLYGGAALSIGSDTLIYESNYLAYFLETDVLETPSGAYNLKAFDSSSLNEQIPFSVPGDFEITSIQLPDNRVNNGGDPVPLAWSLSLNSNGYFFSVVHKDSAYVTAGYSEFVTTGTASATVPRNAFQLYTELDTGWYYVYVCSYHGSPASDFNLPTLIPDGFTDNISKIRLNGRFGTIVVAPRDSIHVTLQ